jgi:hypothetical protein
MLRRYSRSAILEDDFVTFGMKIQPPLFLVLIMAAVVAALLQLTPFGHPALVVVAGLFLLSLLLNLPEVFALARASGRVAFFFRGLGLSLLRGFAWGVGLGVGGMRQFVLG